MKPAESTERCLSCGRHGVLQSGTQRNGTAVTDTRDPDHFAYFGPGKIGSTFDAPGSPRVAAPYDYASGDQSPTDGNRNRFDTLDGVRRLEHGPTGIDGAFTRANIHSPELRLSARPGKSIEVMTASRPYWLASDTDAWTTRGVRDTSGGTSGSFIGHPLEARLQWGVRPDFVRLETGGTCLFGGGFAKATRNATGRGDTTDGSVSLGFIF